MQVSGDMDKSVLEVILTRRAQYTCQEFRDIDNRPEDEKTSNWAWSGPYASTGSAARASKAAPLDAVWPDRWRVRIRCGVA